MVIFGIDLVLLISALMISATPVLLAAIGEAVVEKSGVLNLGVEGMMITGAVIGFIFAVNTQIPIYGFVCAAIAGALLSVLFAVLTQYIMSNQVATGLGLTMVGLGLSALIGKPYEGIKSPTVSKIEIPILSDIPILGPMIFSHDAVVYFSVILVATVAFEVAGPAGQITMSFNSGYGFTAIIVAFLGRLNPMGILLAGLLMALTYIGGEIAQLMLGLPGASIQLLQGMLLFFLLATDIFTNYRFKSRGS